MFDRKTVGKAVGLTTCLLVSLHLPVAAAQLPSTATLAQFKDKAITVADLDAYIARIGSVEGRFYQTRHAALQDLLLTEGYDTIATTVTVPDHPHRAVPLKYPILSQRRFLGRSLQQLVQQETTVTEQDLSRWYDEHKMTYARPTEISAHHIFRQVSDAHPTSSTENQRRVMEQVKAEADKGTSFGLLAEKFSEADSRNQGGSIGRITEGRPTGPQNRRINAKLEQALFQLKEGEVSDIIETTHGLHLLFAKSRQEAEIPSLDELKARGMAGREYLNQRMRDNFRKRIDAAKEKHSAKVVLAEGVEPTTSTALIEIGGVKLTTPHLEELYDRMFTRNWIRVRDSHESASRLLEQVLEDLLVTQAAEDAGLDKDPEAAATLALMERRSKAMRKRNAITAEAYPVTEEQLRAAYEESKETLRQPEAEGEVLVVSMVPHPDTPSQVRAANEARKIADEAERIVRQQPTMPLADLIAKLPKNDDVETSWSVVERHKLGFAENFHMTAFDQALPGVDKPGEHSAVIRVGEAFVIARLKQRFPGEPPEFETLRDRFMAEAQNRNQIRMKEDMLGELKAQGLLKMTEHAEALKESEF